MIDRITVEVVYALPQEQIVANILIQRGSTATEAITQSGLTQRFPELNSDLVNRLGVYGQIIENPEAHVLKEGDRVEIYRQLLIDPKEARRQRAAKLRRSTKK